MYIYIYIYIYAGILAISNLCYKSNQKLLKGLSSEYHLNHLQKSVAFFY